MRSLILAWLGYFETESCFSLEVTLGGSPDSFQSLQDWRSHKCSLTLHHHGDVGRSRNKCAKVFYALPDDFMMTLKQTGNLWGSQLCWATGKSMEPEVAIPSQDLLSFIRNLHQMIQLVASQRIPSCRNSKDIFFSKSCQTTNFTFFSLITITFMNVFWYICQSCLFSCPKTAQ